LETGVPARLSPAEGRKFGLVVGGAFLLFGGISHWRGHTVAPLVLWSLGGVLVLGGLLIPGMLGPVHRAWMGFAHALSKITTPIFMGLVYFVVLAPVGLVRRLFGHNSLVRPEGSTFWAARAEGSDRRSDLQRQF
jgi:saxitoxin biosynthesis operon SxtJ-like protein